MQGNDRSRLFDTWSHDYDAAVADENGFPFEGYRHILDETVRLADVRMDMRILDIGIGTGNLASRFLQNGCRVWGLDFSAEMLAYTQLKYPDIHLVQTSVMDEWPQEIQQPFDRIVSAYLLHEFDLTEKNALLKRMASCYLAPEGYILIADIAFPTAEAREQASQLWADAWDETEYYWVADETITACEREGLRVEYRQISSCGGIFVFNGGERS